MILQRSGRTFCVALLSLAALLLAACGDPTPVPASSGGVGGGGGGGGGNTPQSVATTAPATTAPATTAPATTAPVATTPPGKGETGPTAAPTTEPATTAPATTIAPTVAPTVAQPDVVACTNIPASDPVDGSIRIPSIPVYYDGQKGLNTTGTMGNKFNEPFKDKALLGATDFIALTEDPNSAAQKFDAALLKVSGWKNALNTISAPGTGGKRLISLYSDGGTDFLITIEPADGFLTTYAAYISDTDKQRITDDVKATKYIRTRYVGKGIVKAVCGGKLPDFILPGKKGGAAASDVPTVTPTPTTPNTTPNASAPECANVSASPLLYGDIAVPSVSINEKSSFSSLPSDSGKALLGQFNTKALVSNIVSASVYDTAQPADVAAKVAARYLERPDWHSALTANVVALNGGKRYAVLVTNNLADILVLIEPAESFPQSDTRTAPGDADKIKELVSGAKTIAYEIEGRGLVKAVCQGVYPAFKPKAGPYSSPASEPKANVPFLALAPTSAKLLNTGGGIFGGPTTYYIYNPESTFVQYYGTTDDPAKIVGDYGAQLEKAGWKLSDQMGGKPSIAESADFSGGTVSIYTKDGNEMLFKVATAADYLAQNDDGLLDPGIKDEVAHAKALVIVISSKGTGHLHPAKKS